MVTIEEAQLQAQQARTLLEQKRQEADDARRRVEEQQRQIVARQSAQEIRSGSLSGLSGIQRRQQLQNAIAELRNQEQEIQSYRQQLENYEQQELIPAEQEIADARQRQAAYEEYIKRLQPRKGGGFGTAGFVMPTSSLVEDAERRLGMSINPEASVAQLQELGLSVAEISAIKQQSLVPESVAPIQQLSSPSLITKGVNFLGSTLFGTPTGQRYSLQQVSEPVSKFVSGEYKWQQKFPFGNEERNLFDVFKKEREAGAKIYATEVPISSAGKTKQLLELLNKNKFEKLAEFYGELETSVKERNVVEQNKYLNEVYKKYFKDKPKGQETFKKILEDLYERGIYKGVPIEIVEQVHKEAPAITTALGIGTQTIAELLKPKQTTIEPSQVKLEELQNPFFDVGKASTETSKFGELGSANRFGNLEVQDQSLKELSDIWGKQTITPLQSGIEKLKQKGIISEKMAFSLITGINTKQTGRQITTPTQTSIQTQIPIQTPRLGQSISTGLKETTGLKIPTPQRPTFRTPTESFRTISPTFLKGILKKSKTSRDSGFDVFVRTRGRDVRVGSKATAKEAFDTLFGRLGKTLRASGFVSKKGRKVNPPFLPSMFRPSKRDSFRVVEKRRYRLDMPSEVSEIMGYPKKRRKKRKK